MVKKERIHALIIVYYRHSEFLLFFFALQRIIVGFEVDAAASTRADEARTTRGKQRARLVDSSSFVTDWPPMMYPQVKLINVS